MSRVALKTEEGFALYRTNIHDCTVYPMTGHPRMTPFFETEEELDRYLEQFRPTFFVRCIESFKQWWHTKTNKRRDISENDIPF